MPRGWAVLESNALRCGENADETRFPGSRSRLVSMKFHHRSKESPLASKLVPAIVGGAVAVLIAKNFFQTEKTIQHEIVTDYAACDPTFVRG